MPHKTSPGEEPGLEGDFEKKSECIQHRNYSLPARRFKNLFLAYSGAHGRVRLGDVDPKTYKRKGKARTDKFASTPKLFQNHLAGKGDSLGLIPLLDDGETVRWGAIDIDEYKGLSHAKLCEKITNLRLPLVVARTKSGGAHCYLFLREPTSAAFVQSVLRTWAGGLDYPDAEIFPKQTRREGDNPAGWLNMPYYGDDRWAFDETGKRLSLEAFLAYAEYMRVDVSALVPFDGIEETVTGGKIPPPGRNRFLFNLACSLRGQGWSMDDIEAEVRARNMAADVNDHINFADGPLDETEVRGIIQSAGRYEKGGKVRPGIPPRLSLPEVAAADARSDLNGFIPAWVAETFRRRQEQDESPYSTLINAGAGTGKSHTVLKHLPADSGPTFYYVPTVEIGLELSAWASLSFDPRTGEPKTALDCLVVRGRTHKDKDGNTLCARPALVKEAADHHIRPVSEACCYKKATEGDEDFACPHYSECDYYAQFDAVPDVVFLSHEYLFQPTNSSLGKPDRIVIDEDLVKSLPVTPAHFPPSALEGKYARIILDALVAGESVKEKMKALGITRKELEEEARELDTGADCPIHPAMSDEEMRKLLKNTPKSGPMPMLLRRLAEELNAKRSQTYSLFYRPEHEVPVVDDEGNTVKEKQPRLFVQYRRRDRLPKGVPVLLLDATANQMLLDVVFPGLDVFTIKPRRNAYVIQTTHQVAGKGAMEKPERLREVEGFLERLDAVYGGGAIISNKEAIERLRVPKNWESGWFNNIRGSNAFENCPVGVIVGRIQPPDYKLVRIARGFLYDTDVELNLQPHFEEVERGYRMRSGELWGTDVSEHPDPYIQAMLETKREAEVEQAIDRLRLVNDDTTKTVFLLTSIPCDVTVDQIVPWRSLLGTDPLEKAIQELGGVMPLKAAWLADRLPELWGTEKAAERAIDRKSKNSLNPPIRYIYLYRDPGVCRIKTTLDAQEYEFRSKGQARATRVWSLLSPPETRHWLEREFGPLISFKQPMSTWLVPEHESDGTDSYDLAFPALVEAYRMLTGENPTKVML